MSVNQFSYVTSNFAMAKNELHCNQIKLNRSRDNPKHKSVFI